MGTIKNWFGKWGMALILGIVGVALLFALGGCVYTAIINPFVGIVGIVGVGIAIAFNVWAICQEVQDALEAVQYDY